jgi:hypothetical protein
MVAHTLARFPLAPRLHLAVTVIACLAACGGGEEAGTPAPAPTETATAPEAGAPAGAPQGRRAGATPVTTTSVEPSGSD